MHVPVLFYSSLQPIPFKRASLDISRKAKLSKRDSSCVLNILYIINILATEYFDRAVAKTKKMGGRTSCEKVNE